MKPLLQLAMAATAVMLLQAQAASAQGAEGRWYNPGPFDSVELSGSAVVHYQQGPTDQVFIEGDEEAQKAVTLELRNGRLSIRPTGAWRFWNNRRAQITVVSNTLARLSISGAADWLASAPVQVPRLSVGISGAGLARFDQLKAEQLTFSVSGSGNGQVAGAVEHLNISIAGRSDFRGENLQSQNARVSISGIGNVQVWAMQELMISVSGIGTVDYWGSANVQRRSSGVARINDHGAKAAPGP